MRIGAVVGGLLLVGAGLDPRLGDAPTGRLYAVSPPASGRVFIPGGEFVLGSGAGALREAARQCSIDTRQDCRIDRFTEETPARRVRLHAFSIDRTEVTQAAYRTCVEQGGCTVAAPIAFDSRFSGPEQPVIGVRWEGARRYCQFVQGRLPTEAEWEFAARGPVGRRYPWGNLWNAGVCNHGRVEPSRSESGRELWWLDSGDGHAYTAPVGSYPAGASAFGILDLAGNVAEWTADWYAEQSYAAIRRFAPLGPTGGSMRVVRGGSWLSPPYRVRTTTRMAAPPAAASAELGFRCAY